MRYVYKLSYKEPYPLCLSKDKYLMSPGTNDFYKVKTKDFQEGSALIKWICNIGSLKTAVNSLINTKVLAGFKVHNCGKSSFNELQLLGTI